MYLLLYYSQPPVGMPGYSFIGVDVQEFYKLKDPNDYLYCKDAEEYFANAIATALDDTRYKEVKALIIDRHLDGDAWTRAILLAGHIVTTTYQNCSLHQVPVILTDKRPLNISDSSLISTPVYYPFVPGGFHFRTHAELFTQTTDPITEEPIFQFVQEGLTNVDLHRLRISGMEDSHHQQTNEWGAMRLAHNFGLGGQINFSYPRHLYFKYLVLNLKDGDVPLDTQLHGLFKNVLLIDDQSANGWQDLLVKIFNCQVDAWIPPKKNWSKRDFDSYDLILLDLYLEGRPDSKLAVSLLQFIKGQYPHIPVVMFTASEKAWNMDTVFEEGADGMYIKESPLHWEDEKYSPANYAAFKKTIRDAYEKYKFLRRYWEIIQRILADTAFQQIENGGKKIRERLVERLRMFYGLLKKGYEQSNYDKKTFFYSDYELAFMTLWSMLNEIQEYKTPKRPGAARKRSMEHIADEIGKVIKGMGHSKEGDILARIKELNNIRNRLYLTHGNSSPDYFADTEANKRGTAAAIKNNIWELFGLVAYLLTGNESITVRR